MHDFFKHSHDVNKGTYRIFAPEWKAEILHWFEREEVEKEQKEAFIKALIDFDDGCGGFYRYRAYFLAAEAIARFPNSTLADEIVGQLLKWSYAYFRQDKRDWKIYPQPLVEAARAALEVTDRKRVIAAFTKLVHTTESRAILRSAAEKLGQIDPGNYSAIAALVGLIQVTQNKYHLSKTVNSLRKIDPDNRIILPSLIKLIQSLSDRWQMRDAIRNLGKIGTGNEAAIAIIMRLIRTTCDRVIYEEAIGTLAEIAPGNDSAIAEIISILKTAQDSDFSWLVAEALGQIGIGNETARATLTQMLQETQDEAIRCLIAASLVKIDPGNPMAIAALSQIIESTQTQSAIEVVPSFEWSSEKQLKKLETETIRWRAAESLALADKSNTLAIATLFEIALTTSDYPPTPAHYSLGKIDLQLAIDALIQLMQKPTCSAIMGDAINHFGRIVAENKSAIAKLDEFIAALVQFIQTSEDVFPKGGAAHYLGKLAPGNQLAIATLVNLIQTSPDYLLEYNVYHLGQIGIGDETAISTLIQFIQTTDHRESLVTATFGLQNILQNGHFAKVVSVLKNYLGDWLYESSHSKAPSDDDDFEGTNWWYTTYASAGDRYNACYKIIWHCAQNMTYPDFYNAWHNCGGR